MAYATSPSQAQPNDALLTAIAVYWDEHIHDLEIATEPVGSAAFFAQLDAYRFDKLRYLPKVVNFPAYKDKQLLEIGCGVGLDLARFAKAGATVTGIDLAKTSIDLAKTNVQQQNLSADLYVMNGEAMPFEDNAYDVVYAHGVLQYTADAPPDDSGDSSRVAPRRRGNSDGLQSLFVAQRFIQSDEG